MRSLIIATTAALALGASALIGCNKDETARNTDAPDTRTAGEKTRDAVAGAGQKTGDALGSAVDKTREAAQAAGQKIASATQPSSNAAAQKSRDTLANIVQAALTTNGLSDVVDEFTKADRERIGTLDKNASADLNAAIERFRADWKAKYNEDFKISNHKELAFGAPVELQFGQADAGARLAGEKIAPDNTDSGKVAMNASRISFPAENGLPLVRLPLENEGMVTATYKINVPDSLDARKLHDNLLKHVTQLDGMKADWPADVNQACRIVAQHVAAAISDTQ